VKLGSSRSVAFDRNQPKPRLPPLDQLVPDRLRLLRRHGGRVGLQAASDLLAGLDTRIARGNPPFEPVNVASLMDTDIRLLHRHA
jgi:hypothetical protein